MVFLWRLQTLFELCQSDFALFLPVLFLVLPVPVALFLPVLVHPVFGPSTLIQSAMFYLRRSIRKKHLPVALALFLPVLVHPVQSSVVVVRYQ